MIRLFVIEEFDMVVFKVASKCTCSCKLQIFVVVKFTMHSIVAVRANY